MRVCGLIHFSHVQLFATPWTMAHQAPLSMGFSRHEYWSGLPCPPPGDQAHISYIVLHRQEGSLPLVQPGTPYYTVCIKQSEEQFMLLLKQALKKISSLTAAVTVTNNDITTLASVCHLTVALRKPQFLSLKIQGNLKTRQLSSV